MKKILLLMTIVLVTSTAAIAKTEPLLLEPLSPSVLSNQYGVTPQASYSYNYYPETTVSQKVYEATFANQLPANMVPQNAAAKGKPVPAKKAPKVKIQTKQRSQGNAYWNPGGKGTKAYF